MVARVIVGSPSSPTSTLSSAPAGSTPSRISRTQPMASESRSVPSICVTSLAFARLNGSTWRSSVTSIASSVSSSGTSPLSVRITNAPAPSCASTVTSPRQRSESLSQDSTSASGCSSGKRASSCSTAFEARGSAGTRQCLRRQSNHRRGSSLTASFSSSSNANANTSSRSRPRSESIHTRPCSGAASVSVG